MKGIEPMLNAQAIDRLVEREFLVKLEFTETILGSRPTESIAAKWVEQQERAALAREIRAGSTHARAGGLVEAGANRVGSDPESIESANGIAAGMIEETTADEAAESSPEDRLSVTGFSADPVTGRLHLWDFQVMGFLKGAAQNLDMKVAGKRAAEVGAGRQIQTLTWVFGADSPSPFDRRLYLQRPSGPDEPAAYLTEPDGLMDRPLRAMTAKGERVSIAISEQIHPPAFATCRVVLLRGNRLADDQIHELFTYGFFQGLGQWRSGGWGRFVATIERTK
jgi:hypothetical protein